jgi:branched-chain amino acid transport system permease protein
VLAPEIAAAAVVNGLTAGAVYALIAVGLTLVYGVLHIINFAHGAILGAAMFAAYLAYQAGTGPYLAMIPLAVLFFGLGYGVQRLIIAPAGHGDDRNVLLVTLGLSIMIENVLLAVFSSDTRTIDTPYSFSALDLGFMYLALPKAIAFAVSCAAGAALWVLLVATDTGKAIRAVAKERMGAALAGIDPPHIFAITFGLSAACLAIAACLLLPVYYVNPRAGEAYVLIAFTIVVLGGMGSIPGAMIGGLLIGIAESVSGLFFGDSLGQLGIYLIFILVLLLRPKGLFGAASS